MYLLAYLIAKNLAPKTVTALMNRDQHVMNL